MATRIVIKAKDANIVKNPSTAPGCEIHIDDPDSSSIATALAGAEGLRNEVEDSLLDIDTADSKAATEHA